MENQYFVPKLDELFIGYELEYQGNIFHKLSKSTEWKKAKVGITQEGDVILPITRIASMIKKGWIRTPYLTEEILEKEGWKFQDLFRGSGKGFRKDKYYMNTLSQISVHPYQHRSKIYYRPEGIWGLGDIVFDGIIKSVNELRKVEQYLFIEE